MCADNSQFNLRSALCYSSNDGMNEDTYVTYLLSPSYLDRAHSQVKRISFVLYDSFARKNLISKLDLNVPSFSSIIIDKKSLVYH